MFPTDAAAYMSTHLKKNVMLLDVYMVILKGLLTIRFNGDLLLVCSHLAWTATALAHHSGELTGSPFAANLSPLEEK